MSGIGISYAPFKEHEEYIQARQTYEDRSNAALLMIIEITRMSPVKHLVNFFNGRYTSRAIRYKAARDVLKERIKEFEMTDKPIMLKGLVQKTR